MAQTTETPVETHAAATTPDALPLNRLALLGTFIKPDDASTALVRTPSGDTQSVRTGDTLGRYTVVAIEAGTLYMARPGGRSRTLTLPGDS